MTGRRSLYMQCDSHEGKKRKEQTMWYRQDAYLQPYDLVSGKLRGSLRAWKESRQAGMQGSRGAAGLPGGQRYPIDADKCRSSIEPHRGPSSAQNCLSYVLILASHESFYTPTFLALENLVLFTPHHQDPSCWGEIRIEHCTFSAHSIHQSSQSMVQSRPCQTLLRLWHR